MEFEIEKIRTQRIVSIRNVGDYWQTAVYKIVLPSNEKFSNIKNSARVSIKNSIDKINSKLNELKTNDIARTKIIPMIHNYFDKLCDAFISGDMDNYTSNQFNEIDNDLDIFCYALNRFANNLTIIDYNKVCSYLEIIDKLGCQIVDWDDFNVYKVQYYLEKFIKNELEIAFYKCFTPKEQSNDDINFIRNGFNKTAVSSGDIINNLSLS